MKSVSHIKTSGVYKMTHKVTGQFYIGASKHCELRFYQHHRRIVNGKAAKRIMAVVNQHGNHWSYEILEHVKKHDKLDSREMVHLKKHANNPKSLNRYLGAYTPVRNMTRTIKDGNVHSKALLGKNLKDPRYTRDEVVSFISPDGKLYKNIRSIKRFAKQHNLNQGAMNRVAQRALVHYTGWRLPETPYEMTLTPAEHVDLIVVSPEGKEYHVTNLIEFSRKMNFNYHPLYDSIVNDRSKTRVRDSIHTDDFGRRWHVKGKHILYTVTHVKTGQVYDNVIVPHRLAKTLGIPEKSFYRVLKGEAKRAGRLYTITPKEIA